MGNELIKYLSKYISLSEEEVKIIGNSNLIREYKKDSVLLKEGQTSKECFLVLKGCVRSYYLLNGEEKTTDFFTENEPITPVSYTNKKPSEYYLTCLEDCILSVGNPEKSQQFLKEFPKLATVFVQISNELMSKNQISLDKFKTLSPEKRYLHLMENRPDLIQRIPQYHLASYLGIQPQSLSRIRKRLTELKK